MEFLEVPFTVLGVNAALGRVFNDGDDQTPGAHPVAVISHGYWSRRLGADPTVIGRTLRLSGISFTIVGVTAPQFRGLEVGNAPDVWVPMMMMPQVMRAEGSFLEAPNVRILKVVGRLKSEVPTRQAAAALEVVFRHINQELADLYRGEKDHAADAILRERLELTPCGTGFSSLRPQFARPLAILMVVVALVLLIACVNVANLQLARAAVRQREIALRLSLGAGRIRLIRQLFVESSLLAGLGGAFGLLFAWWSTKFILALLSSGRTPVTLDIQLDYRVLSFTATVSILTAILFGLVPAFRATGIAPALALKEDSRGAAGGGARWVKALIVSQVALSTLLLIGAGLFVRTLHKLTQVETGIRAESVFAARVEPKGSDRKSENASRLSRIYRELIERVEALPGVRSASLSNPSPFSHGDFGAMFPPGTLAVDGSPPPGEEGTLIAQVYPKYFATLGIGVLQGRDFTPAECATNAPRVAVIGATMARRFFQAANPVGRLLRDSRGTIEIIGVVEDAKYGSLKEEDLSVVYFPFPHAPTNRGQMTLQIRVRSHSPALIAAIRREVQAVDPEMPLFEVLPLTAHVDASIVQERLMATVVAFFGSVALLLAAIGLYGVLAFSVNRRTREIGVRLALGARHGDVLTLILWQGTRLALAGTALGLLAALGATRLIAGLLFGVSPLDPPAFLGVIALLAAVALLACWLPARRAARVDPMVALRAE